MRALALLAVTSCGGWSPKDTLLEAAYLTAAAADETQTQQITASCSEWNPIIEPCGQGRVGPYFFATDVVHLAVSLALPPAARTVWQSFTAGVEVTTVWKNYEDGISFWP